MILLDAIYINNSGGKILLDYLITKFESEKLSVFYLLDNRVKNNHPKINDRENIFYLNASLLDRHKFYKKNKNKFLKIFCFGNLPPSIRTNAVVYTYFHQKLFLEIPKRITFKQKLAFMLKSTVFTYFKKNTDFWLVQTKAMEESLSKKMNFKSSILIIPFYPELISSDIVIRDSNSFLYVSSGSDHKNHKVLLEGFKHFYDENNLGTLHLTIDESFTELNQIINELIKSGYPIINHGFVEQSKLINLYKSCTFVIYPSLSESFGLGIIEALENNCKIIGANLPYTFAVCEPSLIFEPNSFESISESFKIACHTDLKVSKQLVFNEIDNLIKLLK
ncbi:glycosyltransferase [Myroides sp. JBRI-B21084]|uniref:glycosyltransferase n=1 Tax=Myroides sp. JBRI-B21084 TaxID=3119977 RepID=UPI0026E160C6|nr:glycosyltransferase [Paenimyroides cloacae]WKW45559.1 glycosyltransferase [Paenimyroides cloacae]